MLSIHISIYEDRNWISDFLSKNPKPLKSTYDERQQLIGMCRPFVPNNTLDTVVIIIQGLAAVEQGWLTPRRCQCRQALVCATAVVSQQIGSRDAHCSLRNVCVLFLAKMKLGQKVRFPHFYPSRLIWLDLLKLIAEFEAE